MPLPASGALSLTQIQTEMGGSNPISLSEYYLGGGIVRSTYPDGFPINSTVPSSGQISFSNFYSAAGVFVFDVTISTHTANYNLNNAMTSAGWNGVSPVLVTVLITETAIVYSNQYNGTSGDLVTGNNIGTGGTPAFYVGTLPARSTVTIQNNGTIAGSGGLGGIDTAYIPANGGAGSPGFVTHYAGTTQVNNGSSGKILGGGGGGGAGSLGPPYSGGSNTNAAFAGGYGGPGGAGLVSFNGLLIINNNNIIGGGGGGGNGGQGLAWSSSGCGATGNPYYLSEGSGGGGGGKSGQDFAPAQGGAIGRPFYCSGFVRARNSEAGSNGRIDDTLPAGGLGGKVTLGGGAIIWEAGPGGPGSATWGVAGTSGGNPYANQLPVIEGSNSNPPGRGGYSVYGATSTGGSFAFQNTGAIFGSYFDE
jgi:hypothetical protein